VSRGKIIAGVIALVVVGVIIAGVVVSAGNSAPQVTVAKAEKQTLGVIVTASGKVEAGSKADVFPSSPGLIASVQVTDGARVTAGQVLATLDSATAALQVAQAEAGVKAARAQVETVKNSKPGTYDKEAAEAGLRAAQAAYDAAKAAYDGWTAAHPAPSGEPTSTSLKLSMLNAEAGLHSAQAANAKAQLCLNAALAAANAGVDSASHALSLAEDAVDKTTLVAPIDGTVIFSALGAPGADGTTPKAEKGAAVAPQSAVFTVVQFGTLNFNAQVDEADIDRVKVGMAGKVRLDAFPASSIEGKVSTIKTAAVQTTTGGIAFPVLLSLSAADKNVLLGMSGSVDIEVSAVSEAITVPIEALFDEEGNKYVFVVKDAKVAKTKVTTGALTDTQAQVLEGIDVGAEVVVGNLSTLKDGMTVRMK
jgi:RND family efflux transporter MFP subunit